MKKALSLILVLMMMFSLAACGAKEEPAPEKEEAPKQEAEAPAPEKEEKTIDSMVYMCATTDNEYFVNVAEGCQKFCDEKGISFEFIGANYDAAEQYSQMENFMSKGVDAFIICPVDVNALKDLIEKCAADGIPVIGQAQEVAGAVGNSIVDDYDYGVNLGTAAADWINKYLADEETVKVCLITLDHQEQVKLRGDGMEETIKKLCPNAEIVYRQKAESTEEGMNVAETALTAHPDIKVIACVNDQMALGAWQAVQNLGLYADDFYIGGGDNTNQIASYIADEACAIRQSVDIAPAGSGYTAAQMAYDIIVEGAEGYNHFFEFNPNWQPGVMD